MKRKRNSIFHLGIVSVRKSQLERKARPFRVRPKDKQTTVSPDKSRPDNSEKGQKQTNQQTNNEQPKKETTT